MQAVRQKAISGHDAISYETIEMVSCCGPQSDSSQNDVRGSYAPQQTATMAAPISSVIFAKGSNPRW